MKLKKICLMVAMFLLSLLIVVSASSDITIYVNDDILQCDVAPFIMDGRTMVPMRKIFEALNATVDWDGETKTITATKDDTHIVLQIDNPTMYNNGVDEVLDVAPVIVNDSTFVPIRAISQSLGASVDWLDYTKTAYINSGDSYYNDYFWSMQMQKVTMYAPDGRTLEVLESEVEAYQNVGWYLYPVVTMYAPDGRTIDIGTHEVNDYINVGWYETYAEAQAANIPSYSGGYNDYGYENDYNYQSSYGGSYDAGYQAPTEGQGETVYVGSTGNKYHRQSCRTLKNGAFPMSLSQAMAEGRTACKICY